MRDNSDANVRNAFIVKILRKDRIFTIEACILRANKRLFSSPNYVLYQTFVENPRRENVADVRNILSKNLTRPLTRRLCFLFMFEPFGINVRDSGCWYVPDFIIRINAKECLCEISLAIAHYVWRTLKKLNTIEARKAIPNSSVEFIRNKICFVHVK